MTPLFKFLRRVRIHGGECGAVARALHHEAQKVALTQNEQSLISDEKALLRQADLKKSFRSTFIERKQMSTKTTLKRIALVAVSALSFGVMVSVSPASATEYVNAITVTTDKAPVAGSTGTVVTHTVTFKASTTAAVVGAVEPYVILASKPSTSAMAETGTTYTTTPLVGKWQFAGGSATTNTDREFGDDEDLVAGSASNQDIAAGQSYYRNYLHAYYDVAGTYTWVFFNDLDDSGTVNGAEFSQTISVVVGSATASASLKATVAAQSTNAAVDGTGVLGENGALVKITLTDSAGNAANVDSSGGIRVSVSGSGLVHKVNGGDVTDAANYSLGQNDFSGSGEAWVNIINATAETVVVSLVGVGSAATSFTSPSGLAVTFRSITGTKTVHAATTTTTTNTLDEVAYSVTGASVTANFKTGQTTAVYDQVTVTDTNGAITGKTSGTALAWDLAVIGSTATADNVGTFSITSRFAKAGDKYTLRVGTGSADDIVATAAALDDFDIESPNATSYRAASGSKQTIVVSAQNQFDGAMANVTITPSIAGRNSTLVLSSLVTDASGEVTFSYTDASTSTTSLVDTITFTSGSETISVVVTYTSAANFGADSILLTTAKTKTTGADADVLSSMYWDIAAAAAGPTGGKQAVTATVKDANSVVLAGVPVTFTVTGTGCAITEPTKTRVTAADGTASANVYAWLEGKCVVTGTVGTVTDDVNTYWNQTTPGETRTYTATSSSPRVVVVTAKDRFGNSVVSAAFKATIVGDGFFGTGTNVATGDTGTDGTMRFITLESATDVTVRVTINDTTNYQADASKGLVASNTATDIFTAAAAGDSLTEEKGVGITFDEAGTLVANPLGLDVVIKGAPSAATVAAEAASDAAAEAIDAANAATDAANLAAEAADAATVAAEEARDAADAATAAVEELATQVATLMAALKAQITTLANTVAKIAKKVKA